MAIIFDIDGTLIDSNYLHVVAWLQGFNAGGLTVPSAELHRRIGMGSGQLLEGLADGREDDVKAGWRAAFDAFKSELRPLPGATALVTELARRGATVGLASSAEEEDVEALLNALGAGDAVAFTTSAGDVDEAKPEPEVFEVALERAGVGPADAIVVGDTVWDVLAARRAGLGCVCVLTGGISHAALEAAGAVAVYDSPLALLDDLDASPLMRFVRS